MIDHFCFEVYMKDSGEYLWSTTYVAAESIEEAQAILELTYLPERYFLKFKISWNMEKFFETGLI